MITRISKSAQVMNSAGGVPFQVSVIRRNSERATIRARDLALPLQFKMCFADDDTSWHQCQIIRQHGYVITVRVGEETVVMERAVGMPNCDYVAEVASGQIGSERHVCGLEQPCATRPSAASECPGASKHSVSIGGHKTSVRLSDTCWKDLCEIARDLGARPSQMVRMIDDKAHQGLSSAVREFVTKYRELQSGGDNSEGLVRATVASLRNRRRPY